MMPPKVETHYDACSEGIRMRVVWWCEAVRVDGIMYF